MDLGLAASILAGLNDGAVLLDRSLRYVANNRALVEMLGVRPRVLEQIFAGSGSPFDHFGNANATQLAEQAMAEQRLIRLHEVDFATPSGENRTAIVTFMPIIDQARKEAIGVIFIARDVSAEARMQRHYNDLLAQERARGDELERRVRERTLDLERALSEVTRLARTDPLTGALNRRAFAEFAEQALLLAERNNRTFGILLCDLDHFKQVNDTYGHQAGDAVLTTTVEILAKCLRKTDKIGRFGGEEFVVLLAESQKENVLEIGWRCQQAVRELPLAQRVPGAMGIQTISIGCAFYPDHGKTLDELLSAADQALYYAKERGRDRVEVFSRQFPSRQPEASAADACRALLVHPRGMEAESYRQTLSMLYRTSLEHDVDAAIERFRSEPFDIFVARRDVEGASGIDFLRESMVAQPNAIRVLLTDTEDFSDAARSANDAGVDRILLERDGPSPLVEAIESSLRRHQVARQRMLSQGPGWVRPAPRSDVPDLEAVLERRALAFAYQPIVGLTTGCIEGYEALCRPNDGYFNNPRSLVDAAVASGKIWNLSRALRRIVAADLEQLPDANSAYVNLHPADLDDPELLDGESFLTRWAPRVIFEITERSWIPDFERCGESVRRLRELGFRVAIDDLGSGYASLNSVALLEPHFIKIDGLLISGIDRSQHKAALVRRMVEFARDAGIEVVAEGVERAEEAATIADLDVHLAQGYFFGRPSRGFQPLSEAGSAFLTVRRRPA